MAKVSFSKKRPPIEVAEGVNLRMALLKNKVPLASSCGGAAVCSKCWVKVIEGADHITPPGADEERLRTEGSVDASSRLSCMVEILGDIVIDTTYW